MELAAVFSQLVRLETDLSDAVDSRLGNGGAAARTLEQLRVANAPADDGRSSAPDV